MTDQALIHEEGSDYILKEDRTSVWILVGDISVYISRTPRDSVSVRLCAHGQEGREDLDLAECSAYQQDAIDLNTSTCG